MESAKKRIVAACAPWAAYLYIRLLRATMRLEYRGREVLERMRAEHGTYILAFWHSRFVMMPYVYPDRRIVVLLSRHRDARMLGEVMRRFGFGRVWGSTTAGGAAATREIVRKVADGFDVAIAPDGPRGPRRVVQPGVVAVARLTGKPIVPVAFSARPMRRLNSWDRTMVPFPFARGAFFYGDPIVVSPSAGRPARERARTELQRVLERLTDEADVALGVPTVPAEATSDR